MSELSGAFGSSLQISIEGAVRSALASSLQPINTAPPQPQGSDHQDEGHTADNEMDVDDGPPLPGLPKNHRPRGKKSKEENDFHVRDSLFETTYSF